MNFIKTLAKIAKNPSVHIIVCVGVGVFLLAESYSVSYRTKLASVDPVLAAIGSSLLVSAFLIYRKEK